MEKLVICVGRQLGSGGSEIARKLAEEFGLSFYDKELINMAAERSGFTPRLFENNDESHGKLHSLFQSFSGRMARFGSVYGNSISQENLFQIQSEAIFKVAKTEGCVFVGRCADYILRNKENLFSVFITADDEQRTRVVSERLGCDMPTARKYIAKKESERASYYNYYTSKQWGAAESYDLCINSCMLGIDKTVETIAQIIRERMNNRIVDK